MIALRTHHTATPTANVDNEKAVQTVGDFPSNMGLPCHTCIAQHHLGHSYSEPASPLKRSERTERILNGNRRSVQFSRSKTRFIGNLVLLHVSVRWLVLLTAGHQRSRAHCSDRHAQASLATSLALLFHGAFGGDSTETSAIQAGPVKGPRLQCSATGMQPEPHKKRGLSIE